MQLSYTNIVHCSSVRRQAKFLRYLDVSENTLDRRAVDFLVQAITATTVADQDLPAVQINLNDGYASESERMAEDESGVDDDSDQEPLFAVAPLLRNDSKGDERGTVLSIRLENCGLKGGTLEALGELFFRPWHSLICGSSAHISIA